MIKSCFITGSTGQVGLLLLEELLSQKVFNTVIYKFKERYAKTEMELKFVIGDVTDKSVLETGIPDHCDCVFHCAGVVGNNPTLNRRQKEVNHLACVKMVEVCLEKKVKKLVHISSVAAYIGKNIKIGQEYCVNEKSEKTGGNSNIYYHKTKFWGEEAIMDGVWKGLNATIINPGPMTGEYDIRSMTHVVKEVYRGILHKVPPGKFSLADGREVAKAMIQCYRKSKAGESYLLGGENVTMYDYANIVAKQLGMEIQLKKFSYKKAKMLATLVELSHKFVLCGKRPPFTREVAYVTSMRVTIDSSKAINELGFKLTPLEELVKRNIAFIKENNMLTKKSSKSSKSLNEGQNYQEVSENK